jgi:S-adenosylmethionine hydrolase
MRPIIALLTDFGTRDHYVGAMKGAILSVAPEAQVVDLLHDLDPHDVEGGAYALGAAYRAFPPGTVFAAVVDPGVGSTRRGIAVEAGAHRFVGPDNGLMTAIFEDHPAARVHALTNHAFWRPDVAATFHGRDVFGPVAAHLALGIPVAEMGPAVTDAQRLAIVPVTASGKDEWSGAIVHVDRFGNLTTNVSARALDGLPGEAGADRSDVVVLMAGVVAPLVRTYADVPPGEPCALVGSSGRLELAMNGRSAAAALGAGRGTPVRIRRVHQPAI